MSEATEAWIMDGTEEMLPITVSDVNRMVAELIGSAPYLSGILVNGEVSDFKRYDSGHWYFNLKDGKSQIKAVMWRSSAIRQMSSGFIPENGMLVTVRCDVAVYEVNGVYQLVVRSMSAAGEGEKYAAFLRLKRKLSEEGLTDASRKLPLPGFVMDVGLITSPSSAAAKDFIKVARQRWGGIGISIFPAIMQGSSAPDSIIAALKAADGTDGLDVLCLARGGGSTEDLWCFNDESLARAIAAVRKPIVTGIGHEIDVTLADLVADVRASTPSNAAELIVGDASFLNSQTHSAGKRLRSLLESKLSSLRGRLENMVVRSPMSRPMDMVDIRRQSLDVFSESIGTSFGSMLARERASLRELEASLEALNPEAVLGRGYSLCTLLDGTVVKDASQAGVGSDVVVRLNSGELGCIVKTSKAPASSRRC